MGEIDDVYKGEAEALDQDFLEELKTTKNHDKSFKNYRKNLLKSRAQYIKKYDKFNARETRRIRGMKKKLPKNEKFKHLIIKHFSFEFNFWERTKMRCNVGWFNFVRKVSSMRARVIPSWLIYSWCKGRDFVRCLWRDFAAWREVNWDETRAWGEKTGIGVWEGIKGVWVFVRKMSGKILFWQKPVVKKEGEKAADAAE